VLLPRFTLHRPRTLGEALALLAEHGDEAAPYAGGTELLLAMKHRVLRYAHLVDLKRVPGLGDVALAGGALVLGALATHRTLERDPLVRRHLPAYAAMSAQVANVRVRAAGTLGGNLCFAEPHADPPPLLAALDARVTLEGPDGRRDVPLDDFLVGAFDTCRAPGEVLTRVTVPLSPHRRVAYLRFGHLERPTIGVAVALETTADGRTITAAHIRVGAVGGRPAAAVAGERALAGVDLAGLGDVARDAAARASAEVPVDADLRGAADYKRHLVGVLVERALLRAGA
jgi:carbon-monoxide dehydrogenase medium subunit